ncbi:MAG: signal peptide peptidase SppA [Acidobacteriota bacterium]|nr:signal peptide peptidase SppA [Acidobacteriota bacterium]
MAKFLIGLLTGVLLVFLTIGLLFLAMLRFRDRPPDIADNSVLVLRLDGDVPEKTPVEIPFLSGAQTLTVTDVWMTLRKAAADSRIKALVVLPEGLGGGWAKAEEFRADVEQFRKAGKPTYAYLRTPQSRDYYVASAADRIYLGPQDQFYLKGMRAEIMYFKRTLDKVGVTVDVEHAGKYKDFGDQFTRSDMSPETREVMNLLVDDLYKNLVARIAEGRHETPEQVQAAIDLGPFQASQARRAGLVDELRFEDEMWNDLKVRLKVRDLKKVQATAYVKVPLPKRLQGRERVALVVGEGDIVRGDPDNPASDENSLASYSFDKLLDEISNDSTIRAVVVRIDSPGGEVTASDDIWRQMNLLSKKKPTVISMSDVAASGGYYMAMTGDPIVAYPGTETGSIGVVFGKPNLHGLYDKLGITKDAVQRGRYAAIDSDYRSLNSQERQKLRDGIDDSYKDFVTKVADARHRRFDEIEPLAQGRVWLGSEAKARGLVDELGGLDMAVALAKKRANIPASEPVTLVMYPARRSLLDLLFRRPQQDGLESRLDAAFHGMPLRAWIRGGMLRMEPYWLVVQ